MLSTLLLCSSLLVAAPDADRAAYEAARAKIGRDAEAHVKLALWCEAHGLNAERTKHLALAVLSDPQNAVARGLLGMVAFNGQWKRPEAVSEKVGADDALMATMKEYQARRARTPETADAQWKLGLWCEQSGLKAEATAHFSVVARLDPSREAAWKRLGCKKFNGLWLTEKQIAAGKEESELQKKADKHWKPLLTKWRDALASKDKNKHAEAERALEDVTDPRAVPAVCAVFGTGDPARQATAVQVLGQIDAVAASRALAVLAVFGKSPDVRRTATETLKNRDLREFAEFLVALLLDPIKYKVEPVKGPGTTGALAISGKKAKYQRQYSPATVASMMLPGDQLGYDTSGLPALFRDGSSMSDWIPASMFDVKPFLVNPALNHQLYETFQGMGAGVSSQHLETLLLSSVQAQHQAQFETNPYFVLARGSMLNCPANPTTQFRFTTDEQVEIPIAQMVMEAQKSAFVAQMQLQNDVKALESVNAEIARLNDLVLPVLKSISGQDLGTDPVAWQKWWLDQVGFQMMPQQDGQTPTFVEQVPIGYQPQPVPINVFIAVTDMNRMSCFGAGTPVQTLSGLRPIETLRPGDLVLSQEIKTGALGYQPILRVYHNPPSPTFRITLGDDTIVSSAFHRFWKAGRGWVMARDLKTGDTIRTLSGLAQVKTLESDGVQPVFNLDVAENSDFFAGASGALVHDNSLPDLRLVPFDAAPDLATIAKASR